MFERFTDSARNMIVVAQNQARDLRHADIGTEHLLAALTLDTGVAGEALAMQGVTTDNVRGQIIELIGHGQSAGIGHIPFTPRARWVIETALKVSIELGHDHVGPEHLLLALVRDTESVASRAIVRVGSTPDKVREHVGELLLKTYSGGTVFDGYTAIGTDGSFDENPLRSTEEEAAADTSGDQGVRHIRFALERGEYFIAVNGGGLPIIEAGKHLDYHRARKATVDRGGRVHIQVPRAVDVTAETANGTEVTIARTIVWEAVDIGTRISVLS